jgi:hypothetical protein
MPALNDDIAAIITLRFNVPWQQGAFFAASVALVQNELKLAYHQNTRSGELSFSPRGFLSGAGTPAPCIRRVTGEMGIPSKCGATRHTKQALETYRKSVLRTRCPEVLLSAMVFFE